MKTPLFSWRLGVAHEIGVGLTAFLAVLIVVMGGYFPLPAWLVLLAPPISAFLKVRDIAAPKFSGTAIALAGIGLGVAKVADAGIDIIVYAGSIALLGILAGRLVTRRELAHDTQTLILSLVIVMAGSVLNPGLSYGLLFGFFGIALIWALCTKQLLAGADRSAKELGNDIESAGKAVRERTDVVTPAFFGVTGGVAVATLAATMLVFFTFPRVGFGSFSIFGNSQAGFPSSVDLSGGSINGGGTRVMARAFRVPQKSFLRGLYLRGMVFDGLSTSGATRTREPSELTGVAKTLAPGPGRVVNYAIMMDPVHHDLVLSLGPVDDTTMVIKGGEANPNRRSLHPQPNARGELSVGRKVVKAVLYRLSGKLSAPGYVPRLGPQRGEGETDVGPQLPPASTSSPPAKLSPAPISPAPISPAPISPAPISPAPISLGSNAGKVGRSIDRNALIRLAPQLALVPADLDPRVIEMALNIGGAPPESTRGARVDVEKVAENLRKFLLENSEYTLSQPNGAKAQPLVSFLLDDRRGHCEYFASAFALMLRINGIPARVVGGYQGGEYDTFDDVVIFRERNAHAWVEWLHPDFGWIVDDATPLANAERSYLVGFAAALDRLQRLWGDLIVDYSLGAQLEIAQSARSVTRDLLDAFDKKAMTTVGVVVGGGFALVLVFRFWRRRSKKNVRDPFASAIEDAASAILAHPIPSDWTLREAVFAIDDAAPGKDSLQRALDVYEQSRFGGRMPDASFVASLIRTLDEVRRAALRAHSS